MPVYRVRSRSKLTDTITDYKHEMSYSDAKAIVDYFNTLYEHLFNYWIEPILTLDTIDEYYMG
jgi:hypothetical protein